jgi:hypothetical protein
VLVLDTYDVLLFRLLSLAERPDWGLVIRNYTISESKEVTFLVLLANSGLHHRQLVVSEGLLVCQACCYSSKTRLQ